MTLPSILSLSVRNWSSVWGHLLKCLSALADTFSTATLSVLHLLPLCKPLSFSLICVFRDWMRLAFPYILVVYVPPRMTSVCQPADTGLQRPIKARLAQKCAAWMVNEGQRLGTVPKLSVGNIKGPGLQWLHETWLEMQAEQAESQLPGSTVAPIITNAWKKAGFDKLHDEEYQDVVKQEAYRQGSTLLVLPRPDHDDVPVMEVAMAREDVADEDAPKPTPEEDGAGELAGSVPGTLETL